MNSSIQNPPPPPSGRTQEGNEAQIGQGTLSKLKREALLDQDPEAMPPKSRSSVDAEPSLTPICSGFQLTWEGCWLRFGDL